jgi:hypothetical protein
MDLIVKDEPYKIKVGNEVYSVDYPSFEDAQRIAREFKELENDGEKSLALMVSWLKELGLDDKFFGLKAIKAKHIMTVWGAINSVKK